MSVIISRPSEAEIVLSTKGVTSMISISDVSGSVRFNGWLTSDNFR
ncbi:MAG: hypothetical protein ABIP75_10490 [Pyrinomonadaceae bacterium]